MPDEVTVSIPEPHDRDDMPELLRSIAESIENGNREGFHPRWALVPADKPDSVKRRRLAELEAEFEAAGGRGVELADEIDALRAELDDDSATCKHCGRIITRENGAWVDNNATGDDAVWRETCDSHDTRTAEHEPATDSVKPEPVTVKVLTISHKHGTDITVHRSEASARKALYDFAVEWWDGQDPLPSTPTAAVNAYFSLNEDESWEIDSTLLLGDDDEVATAKTPIGMIVAALFDIEDRISKGTFDRSGVADELSHWAAALATYDATTTKQI